jgi:uncharacterized protein (DUF2461 family)
MAVTTGSGSEFYLAVGAEGLTLAAGLYGPAPDQLERFRRAIDAGPPAIELDRLVRTATQQDLTLDDGDPLKTAPRGWPREHPRIDLIRRRNLTIGATHPPAPWWFTAELLDVVRTTWEACRPLVEWCDLHVGPSTAAPNPGSTGPLGVSGGS